MYDGLRALYFKTSYKFNVSLELDFVFWLSNDCKVFSFTSFSHKLQNFSKLRRPLEISLWVRQQCCMGFQRASQLLQYLSSAIPSSDLTTLRLECTSSQSMYPLWTTASEPGMTSNEVRPCSTLQLFRQTILPNKYKDLKQNCTQKAFIYTYFS